MKFMVISNPAEAEQRVFEAKQQNYVPFIFHHADPEHLLSDNKFVYVGSEEELAEKIRLVEADISVLSEARMK